MALRDIKRRIKSVKNTSQITKAMEVVSATKMRRSQGIALAGRPFAIAALDMLKNVSRKISEPPAILLLREIKHTLVLVVTSDKGLAGAFNTNVLRLAERWIKDNGNASYSVAAVGKKARDYFAARSIPTGQIFTGFGDYVHADDTAPLVSFLMDGYTEGTWDRVLVFYTNFRSTLKQEARVVEVLPIHTDKIEEAIRGITPEYGKYADAGQEAGEARAYEYRFEPSPQEVFARLIASLFAIQMHHIILESNASEHSARMVAMKNASENAKDLIGRLTLRYNKERQGNITRELIEITGASSAIAG